LSFEEIARYRYSTFDHTCTVKCIQIIIFLCCHEYSIITDSTLVSWWWNWISFLHLSLSPYSPNCTMGTYCTSFFSSYKDFQRFLSLASVIAIIEQVPNVCLPPGKLPKYIFLELHLPVLLTVIYPLMIHCEKS